MNKHLVRLVNAFPFITKSKAAKDLQTTVNRLSEQHRNDLEQERQRVDALIAKLTRLTCSREPQSDVYKIGIAFSSEMMRGYNTGNDLSFLAEMIARQVQHEIASARFIQKADEPKYYR